MPTSCDTSGNKGSVDAILDSAVSSKDTCKLDLNAFCRKRFDIVMRYEILRQVGFDVRRAARLFASSDYAALRDAIAKVNPRLLRKGLFAAEKWDYVEKQICSSDTWLREHPYVVTGNYGSSVKRLLLAVKHGKSLPWIEDPTVKEKSGFSRDEYDGLLPASFRMSFAQAGTDLVCQMRELRFFAADTRIVPKTAAVGEQLIAFIVWQSGDNRINDVIRCIRQRVQILDILRQPTLPIETFLEKMYGVYEIDPSNKDKVIPKIKALHQSTSFLVCICRGLSSHAKKVKDRVRELTGANCIHSCDSTAITIETLEHLFGPKVREQCRQGGSARLTEEDLSTITGFLSPRITVVEDDDGGNKRFSSFCDVVSELNAANISYALVHFGPPIEEDIRKGKDVEIITSNMIGIADLLDVRYRKKNTVFTAKVGGQELKLDFYHSIHLPIHWRNHILAHRVMGPGGYFEPPDIDKFWIFFYERVVLKPYKFRNEQRYPDGGGWRELIRWGNRIGVWPRIRDNMSRFKCRRLAKNYIRSFKK